MNPSHVQDLFIAIAGMSLIFLVISDVFQAIIVPHYRPNLFRLSHILTSRILWTPLRGLASRFPESMVIRNAVTMFAPAAMMTLLACWLIVMVLGYALILWSERAHITPNLTSIEDSIYFAATSVLTVGFGDVVACTFLSRATVVCSAVSGIILLALTVSFLFATQSHFHCREVNAQILFARGKNTCDGTVLYSNLTKDVDSSPFLELCERWIIEIYQSHTAYPFLMYFRSRSSRFSWLTQMGSVLDMTAMVLTAGPEKYQEAAQSIFDTGTRSLAIFANYLGLTREPSSTDTTSTESYVKLFRALKVKEPNLAAATFSTYRQIYYRDLQALCKYFVIALPQLGITCMEPDDQAPAHPLAISAQKLAAPGMTKEFLKTSQGLQRK
jgi:hypothetical protein